MNKTLLKDVLRQIKATKNRFISIMIIVALGTGFFAGLKASSPDMISVAQQYYSDTNLMDIELLSTMGFDEGDINYIKENLTDIRSLRGGYSADLFSSAEGQTTENIVKVLSIDLESYYNDPEYISLPSVTEGRMISSMDECLVDVGLSGNSDYEIGDKITLYGEKDEDGNDSSDDALNIKEFTVVGKITTPVYISHERGQSTIGSGSISSYVYLSEEAFKYEVYTNLYINFEKTRHLVFDDPIYEAFVETMEEDLENIASVRNPERYNAILEEANEKIDDAQRELDDGYDEYNSALAQFEREISSGQRKINNGWNEINKFEKSLPELRKQYDSGIVEYENGIKEYEAGLKKLKENESYVSDFRKVYSELNDVYSSLASAERSLPTDEEEGSVDEIKSIVSSAESTSKAFVSKYRMFCGFMLQIDSPVVPSSGGVTDNSSAKEYLASVRSSFSKMDSALKGPINEYEDGLEKLEDGKVQLEKGKKQLDELKKILDGANKTISSTRAQLREAQLDLNRSKTSAQRELNKAKQELEDGQKTLDEEKKKLDDIKVPEWFIYDRSNNPGYSGYVENTQRIDRVAVVFPIFFVAVAMLVSLTTMSRMVEEQRTQIGTMKALGYSNLSIMSKYIIYAVSASILGSIMGLAAGFTVLPTVIYNAYRSMYVLPELKPMIYWEYAILCTVVAILCTTVAAVYSCNKELKEKPASLMRAKAPKIGKRVFLEKLPFVWNRLNFMQKVTVRNMLRYKKRIAMTVVGIAGCTALLVAGFGLKYSISSITSLQFGEIFHYDINIVLSDDVKEEYHDEMSSFVNNTDNMESSLFVSQETVMSSSDAASAKEAYLFVAKEPEKIHDYISLRDRRSGERIDITDGGAVINEKLAKLLDIGIGDEVSFIVQSGREVSLPVTGITENYALNYIYTTQQTIEEVSGDEVTYNMMLGRLKDDNLIDETSSKLMENEDVLTIVNVSTTAKGTFDEVADRLSLIIVVIIACSGLLEIVVLYNLASINIAERLREIATIKVLGFYENETSDYITRESIISTALGIILGLIMGIPFKSFIVSAAEVDTVMFAPGVNFTSFLYATILTIIFAWVVNIMMYFMLKKIPMAESLKSVE
ncbi:MAG: FtsX-like permease family protein [Eubacteriaceae bacterium]|nr:FtsX-like permease family protein [Eubacteriaceae bacterium]